MGSVKIANGKINLCAENEKAITFVSNWGNGLRVFMCLKGTTSRICMAVRLWQCIKNQSFGVVPSRHIFPSSLIRTLRARLLSLRSVVPSRHLV